MAKEARKVIGVLGGMGPESTAILYRAMITECQRQYGAVNDEDYPEMFIYNLPIPDIVRGLERPKETVEKLVSGTRKLESIGAEVIVMPCNTAHLFYPEMAAAVSTPFICIFLATAKKIRAEGVSKVGFLATRTTVEQRSFADDFERNGIELLLPDDADQEALTRIILNILSGKKEEEDKKRMKSIAEKLRTKGAQAVVLACTDLPIIFSQEDTDLRVFDTVAILAESAISYATGKIGNEILE